MLEVQGDIALNRPLALIMRTAAKPSSIFTFSEQAMIQVAGEIALAIGDPAARSRLIVGIEPSVNRGPVTCQLR